MVKFIYSKAEASAEEVLGNINRYVNVGMDSSTGEYFEEYLPDMVSELEEMIQEMNEKYQIATAVAIQSDSKIKLLFKRAIRKCIKWYLDLVFEQQQNFNGLVTQAMHIQSDIVKMMMTQNKNLREENEKFKLQLSKMSSVEVDRNEE